MGLLAINSALTPATVVGYEEPENGVHPRRLKLIADMLKNTAEATETQFLINTHSPEFAEFFGAYEGLINCRRDGACTIYDTLLVGDLFLRNSLDEGLDEREQYDLASKAGPTGGLQWLTQLPSAAFWKI